MIVTTEASSAQTSKDRFEPAVNHYPVLRE